MEIKKGDYIDSHKLDLDKDIGEVISDDMSIYILDHEKKKYLIKREGSCDYKNCKSICCKFFHISGHNTFTDGFLKRIKTGHILERDCKHLLKSGECDVFKKKSWPGACKHFPHLTDKHYIHISKKCLIKFKVLGEII